MCKDGRALINSLAGVLGQSICLVKNDSELKWPPTAPVGLADNNTHDNVGQANQQHT